MIKPFNKILKRIAKFDFFKSEIRLKTKPKLTVHPSNVYLIEIRSTLNLPLDKYIQEASKGPGERFYINAGSRGRKSISSKSVQILAQNIIYLDH